MGFVSTSGLRAFPGARVFAWLIALFAAFLAPAVASAQTYTWNQSTSGGNWQTPGNWLPSVAPNSPADIAVFGNTATGANTVNLTTGVTVGQLQFQDVNSGSLTAAYTLATGQTITFNNNGSPAQITVGGFTLANQTVASTISVAGSQPLNITNNGAPGLTTLTVSGGVNATTANTALNVGGASNTTLSGPIGGNIGTLTMSGSGVLTLSGTNTYTGGTVITGGVVRIETADAATSITQNLGSTSSTVTINGGALQVNVDAFVDQNITIGSNGGTIITTAGANGSNPTFRGVISGSGPLTIDGGFYADFTANNTYTGATVINNAAVKLTAGGLLSGSTSVTINGYVGGQIGILTLDNSGGGADRIKNTTGITLNGGMIATLAPLFGASQENVGKLTIKGYGSLNTVQVNGGFGTNSVVFSDVERDPFSTLYVGGPLAANSQLKFAAGLTNPGGSGQAIGIIPWIGGDRGKLDDLELALIPTNHASTLYTFNTTNGLVALNPAGTTDFFQVAAGAALNGPPTGAKNNAIMNDPAPLNTPLTILSLVQNPASGFSTITGSGTLTVSTGAVVSTNQISFNGPTLNFGSATGYVWLGADAFVQNSSRITGTNGVVVSSNSENGLNTLYLINSNANTFSGGLYLNGNARVAFDTSDSQLGAEGAKISFRGGTLWYAGNGSVELRSGTTARPLELYSAGGGQIRVAGFNGEDTGILQVSGVISGTEQLTVTGPGTLVLSNTANTYQGGTTLGDSTLAVAGPGSLGTGGLTLGVSIGGTDYTGGTLRFDGPGTYAFNVNHAMGSVLLNTKDNNVTLAGVISGNGNMLIKDGTGTLTLSGANTYTGDTLVNGGTLLVSNVSGSGTGYGAVTVNAGAAFGGRGTVSGSLTFTGNGQLIVGLPNSPGTLTLRGHTTLSGSTAVQVAIDAATPGTGYSQLVIAPGGSIDLAGATLQPTLSYTPNSTDKLFLIDNRNATGGLTGTFNGLADGATVTFADGTTALISYQGNLDTLSITGGNDVVLHSFVPVPEPGMVLGIAALALGAVTWHRRRVRVAV